MPASSLPAGKTKITNRKSKPAAKPMRSAQFVEESDTPEEVNIKASKKRKRNPDGTVSEPVISQPAPPIETTSTSKPSKKRKSPSPSPSQESSSESLDNDESGASSSRRQGSPLPIQQPKQSAIQSDQLKSLQKTSFEKVPLSKSKANATILARESPGHGKSEEDSGSSGSESEDESSIGDPTSLPSLRERSSTRKPTSNTAVVAFEPPSGFEASSIAIHPSSQAAELFSRANLVGKEIWHITAPASVPINLMKEVPTQNMQSTTSNMSYKGAEYGLVPEIGTEAASNRVLLLPSSQTNDYRISESTIVKTVHLQQLIRLPIHNSPPAKSSSQDAAVPATQKEAPRRQPEGLRMRYHPFGASDDSDSISEMLHKNAAKAPQFRVPNPVDDPLAKKRKRAETNLPIPSTDTSPAKSGSKKRKVHDVTDATRPDTAMGVDVTEPEVPQASPQKETPTRTPNGLTPVAQRPNGKQQEQTPITKRKKTDHTHKQPEPPPAPASALPTQIVKEAETIIGSEVVDGASAIDITHSQEKKARRREERRKRKEAANAAE